MKAPLVWFGDSAGVNDARCSSHYFLYGTGLSVRHTWQRLVLTAHVGLKTSGRVGMVWRMGGARGNSAWGRRRCKVRHRCATGGMIRVFEAFLRASKMARARASGQLKVEPCDSVQSTVLARIRRCMITNGNGKDDQRIRQAS